MFSVVSFMLELVAVTASEGLCRLHHHGNQRIHGTLEGPALPPTEPHTRGDPSDPSDPPKAKRSGCSCTFWLVLIGSLSCL